MIGWILAVLALFVGQTLLAPGLQYLGGSAPRLPRLKIALGPRDETPPMPISAERAQRALRNLFEALPVFLTLAILSLHLGVADGLATNAAAVFFVARLVYAPCYLLGAFALRSVVWAVSFAALILMSIPVVRGAL
jgi:uncharacterized MAPEG superfamily protein